jgi:hypothetical protein
MLGWLLRFLPGAVVVEVDMPTFVPIEIQVQAHDLIEVGRLREATRLLARRAQLPRSEAQTAMQVLLDGGVLPDFPRGTRSDLAERARELRDSGRRKEALFTVRSERLMGASTAASYIDAL